MTQQTKTINANNMPQSTDSHKSFKQGSLFPEVVEREYVPFVLPDDRILVGISLKDYGEPTTNYATLVHNGLKTIETRKWKPYSKVTCRHTGKVFELKKPFYMVICCSKSSPTEFAGKAIAIVRVWKVEPMTVQHESQACCQIYPKAQAWHIDDLHHFTKPFDVKGRQKMYTVKIPLDVGVYPFLPF